MTTRLLTLVALVVISLAATIEYAEGVQAAQLSPVTDILCPQRALCKCPCGVIWKGCGCFCRPCPVCCPRCTLTCGMGYWYIRDWRKCVICKCKD